MGLGMLSWNISESKANVVTKFIPIQHIPPRMNCTQIGGKTAEVVICRGNDTSDNAMLSSTKHWGLRETLSLLQFLNYSTELLQSLSVYSTPPI